jgi:hypothetical protein
MGVFAGPVTLEVVEAVCQDDIDLLASAAELLDFALLRRVESGLELLPALREIAREQLEDSGRGPEVRRSHIECLIGIGEETKGPSADQAASARREALLAETWHAAAWARAAQPYLHLLLTRLYAADWGFVQGRVREALAESARALSSAELLATNNERAELMFVHALVLSWCARTDEALQLAELAAELVEDRTPLKAGDDLIMLSMIRGAAGANQGAIDAAREAVALARQAGGPGRLLRNLAYLAQALTAGGDTDAAGPLLDQAEMLATTTHTDMAEALPNLRADWSMARGDPRAALAGYGANLTASIRRSVSGAVLWDAAGITVALAELGMDAAALEAGTLVHLIAIDQAFEVATLRETGTTVDEAINRSLAALPPATAQAIQAAANAIASHDRASRILELSASPIVEPTDA